MLKAIILSTFIFSSIVSSAQVSNSGYINLDDDSIFYETAGSGNVILFIHDGMLTSEVWNDQFSFFQTTLTLVIHKQR